MALATVNGCTPVRADKTTSESSTTDNALQAAVQTAGEQPERAAELAEELGVGVTGAPQPEQAEEEDNEPRIYLAGSPASIDPDAKLKDSDPEGPPLRIVGDNLRAENYAFQTKAGMLVGDERPFDLKEGTTDKIDRALIVQGYGEALRWRDALERLHEQKPAIVRVLVGYKGRPYKVEPFDDREPPKTDDFRDLNEHTAAMALGAAFGNTDIGSDSFISHMYAIHTSPLWPIIKQQFNLDLDADRMEREEWDCENAPLNLYTRGLMAGIQLERMLHGARNKYGELVTDVPQRGEVDPGLLKERRPLPKKSGGGR
jgi:hypothetical protein